MKQQLTDIIILLILASDWCVQIVYKVTVNNLRERNITEYVFLVIKIPKALHVDHTAFSTLQGSECTSHSQQDALSGPSKHCFKTSDSTLTWA